MQMNLIISLLLAAQGFYLPVPYVSQVENYCGPATLSMVAKYWEIEVSQHQIAERVKPFPKRGLTGKQMKELAADLGLRAFEFRATPLQVRQELQKGRPIIAAVDRRLSTVNHFVVIVGWDDSRDQWIVHDPASGSYRRVQARDFEKKWGKLGFWTLLLLPIR